VFEHAVARTAPPDRGGSDGLRVIVQVIDAFEGFGGHDFASGARVLPRHRQHVANRCVAIVSDEETGEIGFAGDVVARFEQFGRPGAAHEHAPAKPGLAWQVEEQVREDIEQARGVLDPFQIASLPINPFRNA